MLFLLFIFALAKAQDTFCGSTGNITKSPYTFPEGKDSNKYLAGSDHNCQWTVTIPPGQYAQIKIESRLSDNDEFDVKREGKPIWSNVGNVSQTETVYALSNAELIFNTVGNTKGGALNFTVQFFNNAPKATKSYTIDPNGYRLIPLSSVGNASNVITIKNSNDETQVALQITYDDEDVQHSDYTGDFYLYDGDSVVPGNEISNTKQYNISRMFESTKHAFTLYFPITNAKLFKAYVFANDAANVNDIDNVEVVNDVKPSTTLTRNSAVLFYSTTNTPFLIDVKNAHDQNEGKLFVLKGGPGGKIIAEYSSNSSKCFPQEFVSDSVTLVSDRFNFNDVVVSMKNVTARTNNTLFFGESRYIFSNNYPDNDKQFVSKSFISELYPSAFDINFEDIALDGVTCTIATEERQYVFSSDYRPPQKLAIVGRNLTVEYNGKNATTTGMKISFTVKEVHDVVPATPQPTKAATSNNIVMFVLFALLAALV